MKTAVLGFPRIGKDRALKKAIESYWKGEFSQEQLEKTASIIRAENWVLQKQAGIDIIPSNDFSFYDQVLDMSVLVGAVPARYQTGQTGVSLPTYFAMARGQSEKTGTQEPVSAMEMTKWFDTNYHYIVPEFHRNQAFKLSSDKPFREFKEAQSLGITTRPVLIGPVTYLLLGKSRGKHFSSLSLLEPLLEAYVPILKRLHALGAKSVQLDEPALVMDLDMRAQKAFQKAYGVFAKAVPDLSIMLTAYFGSLGENAKLAAELPVIGIHLDLTRGSDDPAKMTRLLPKQITLSLGIIDGRNIWKNDLAKSLRRLQPFIKKRGTDKCVIASSCSFLHCPLDVEAETRLDPELKAWFSFSAQKLHELALLKRTLIDGERAVKKELEQNKKALQSRKRSRQVNDRAVKQRLKRVKLGDYARKSPFRIRQKLQHQQLKLPLFPTTTIGSFPQTAEIRKARADFKNGALSAAQYEEFLRKEIQAVINRQEEIGLDVLVHGEPERNDMVEYFGEQLKGFVFTRQGWVQSYGTRCVKPPIIYGDVSRPKPMTVRWSQYAQSLARRPVKGMLTGPITLLQWSFVRDDQPRSQTAMQIALAIRDEVLDLERAGISIIQIDEPAIREGLPLRKREWKAYLKWAVGAFRLAANGVKDQTQIHTHMCYSEFNDIIREIAQMDADVISMEASRSGMELLEAFKCFRYPNEIGPGVYDIHSPRVPSAEEMNQLLIKAARLLPPRNVWVNPDCGLKTRGWPETLLSLRGMVAAAKKMRGACLLRGKTVACAPTSAATANSS